MQAWCGEGWDGWVSGWVGGCIYVVSVEMTMEDEGEMEEKEKQCCACACERLRRQMCGVVKGVCRLLAVDSAGGG
jgi:hypothetical protein